MEQERPLSIAELDAQIESLEQQLIQTQDRSAEHESLSQQILKLTRQRAELTGEAPLPPTFQTNLYKHDSTGQ